MANTFIKAEQIVRAALGLLEREVVLPALVWRDAAGDFTGAKDDTISIRLPAYATARTRTMRSNTGYTVDSLAETKVDLTLDTDVYKAIGITDEELTLDIISFGEQVLRPAIAAVARGMEDALSTTMSGATYENEVEFGAADDPYDALIDARKALNDAYVPMSERGLVVGSSVEAAMLKSDHLSRVDQSGSDSAFRDAIIGRIAGFTAVVAPTLDPDVAIAFHRSAFVLSSRAPVKPDGVAWGSSASFAGLAMRVIRDYDFENVRDRLLVNAYMGSNTVSDLGHLDANGKFVPAEDPDDTGEESIFIRAVKITRTS